MQGMPIFHRGNRVGILRPDRVFVCHRGDEHIMRMFNTFGLSYDVLKNLIDYGCWKIVILYHKLNNTTEYMESTPKRFIDEGILWKDANEDYQRHLHLEKLRQSKLKL